MCACGDSEDFLKATGKTLGECDIECPGDGSETCGGASSYNLYEILVSEFDDGSEGEGSGSDDVDEQSVSSSASREFCTLDEENKKKWGVVVPSPVFAWEMCKGVEK